MVDQLVPATENASRRFRFNAFWADLTVDHRSLIESPSPLPLWCHKENPPEQGKACPLPTGFICNLEEPTTPRSFIYQRTYYVNPPLPQGCLYTLVVPVRYVNYTQVRPLFLPGALPLMVKLKQKNQLPCPMDTKSLIINWLPFLIGRSRAIIHVKLNR